MLLLLLLALPLHAGDKFSYVYQRADDSATISRGSLEEILRLKRRFTGTYLWARVDGRAYLIRDAAALAEMRKAFAPLEALTPHQRALRVKMKPVEQRRDRLERELDDLSDRDDELTDAEHARMRELEQALRALEPELRKYEAQERDLDEREEALERVFDQEVERIVRRAVRAGVAERVR